MRLRERRTVALGGLFAVVVIAAAVLVALPSRHKSSRDAVVRYVASVNAVQAQMRVPLAQVVEADRRFARARTVTPAVQRRLARSERTLRVLARRLAALEAPPQAAELRVRLLRLVARETAITREVEALARFDPAFASALAQLRQAGGQLSLHLAAIHAPTPHLITGTKKQIARARARFARAAVQVALAQAAAIDDYDAAVVRVHERLLRLAPPAALAPAYTSQLRALEITHTAARNLSAELRKRDRAHVPELARAFTVASRTARTVAAQRAEIAAIKAYNRRVHGLAAAAAAVQEELLRLQQTLR